MKYIWMNKESDQIVTVVAELGIGTDGRRYVKIEGSNTGIPFDELVPLDSRGRPHGPWAENRASGKVYSSR